MAQISSLLLPMEAIFRVVVIVAIITDHTSDVQNVPQSLLGQESNHAYGDSNNYIISLTFSGQPDYNYSVSLSMSLRQKDASTNFAT